VCRQDAAPGRLARLRHRICSDPTRFRPTASDEVATAPDIVVGATGPPDQSRGLLQISVGRSAPSWGVGAVACPCQVIRSFHSAIVASSAQGATPLAAWGTVAVGRRERATSAAPPAGHEQHSDHTRPDHQGCPAGAQVLRRATAVLRRSIADGVSRGSPPAASHVLQSTSIPSWR
jgi:hypothetical protein